MGVATTVRDATNGARIISNAQMKMKQDEK